ncbi:hypothetical protein Tco_0664637 [Tanacetum coccineum]
MPASRRSSLLAITIFIPDLYSNLQTPLWSHGLSSLSWAEICLQDQKYLWESHTNRASQIELSMSAMRQLSDS